MSLADRYDAAVAALEALEAKVDDASPTPGYAAASRDALDILGPAVRGALAILKESPGSQARDLGI